MSVAIIYGLYDPVTGELRYIGKANNVAARLDRHIRDMWRRDYPVYMWMRKLSRDGRAPRIEIIESAEDWKAAESRLIAHHRAAGARLLNLADGGDQPLCTDEQRKINGDKLTKILSQDKRVAAFRRAKMALGHALRQGYANNATRQGMRLLAIKVPHIFGCWANIPDRIET